MSQLPGGEVLTAAVSRHRAGGGGVWLFLDYDGTLAEFAPTPDDVLPDPALISLLHRLVQQTDFRIAVVSGRRLAHIQKLLPVPGLLLAGTYGVEMQLPGGEEVFTLEYDAIRPVLEELKPRWQALIAGRQSFYLEDKGWALALHARYAAPEEAGQVLSQAEAMLAPAGNEFRVLGGHQFLELGPNTAHKGQAVRRLFAQDPWPGALPVYLGDDDKDEEAFEVILEHAGLPVLVSRVERPTHARYRLEAPAAVRAWLRSLLA